ncbi:MAG: glycosyltransferase family 39 protein, partial [Deltaproteobacteria bacterium]|nr:glycosyltransferase family 39 protein [Deltaproteobacteria bacterium]
MNRSVVLERLVVTVALLLTVWGIWSHGFWDPWELDAADGGRVGRLPGVVAGWLTCLLAFLLLRRHFSQRAGVIAIAVIASTPLFLLNARLLMGDSVAVFAQTWVGLAAIAACGGSDSTPRTLSRYVLLGIGLAVSTHTSGVLLGPLPPILAVAAWSLLSDDTGRGNRV